MPNSYVSSIWMWSLWAQTSGHEDNPVGPLDGGSAFINRRETEGSTYARFSYDVSIMLYNNTVLTRDPNHAGVMQSPPEPGPQKLPFSYRMVIYNYPVSSILLLQRKIDSNISYIMYICTNVYLTAVIESLKTSQYVTSFPPLEI